MATEAILLLGSNLGDSRALLSLAVEMLVAEGVELVAKSSVLESEPWGFGEGAVVGLFCNQALRISTNLEAEQLLTVTQRVEQRVGRERDRELEEKRSTGERYASRVIDIDIIFYGDEVVESERLRVPHPLMAEREFVLRPMVEVAAEWRHPLLGRSSAELLNELANR
ncbi:MAG: 2-amino-4-hydroxy-6-hydroxymethyldihydropteridine diphosphokinase [Rikenellaceae bacterium]